MEQEVSLRGGKSAIHAAGKRIARRLEIRKQWWRILEVCNPDIEPGSRVRSELFDIGLGLSVSLTRFCTFRQRGSEAREARRVSAIRWMRGECPFSHSEKIVKLNKVASMLHDLTGDTSVYILKRCVIGTFKNIHIYKD